MMKALSSSCASSHQGAVTCKMTRFFKCIYLFPYSSWEKGSIQTFGIWGIACLIDRPKNMSDVGIAKAVALPCSSIQQSHKGVVLLLLFLLSIDLNAALHVWPPLGKKWVKRAFSNSKDVLLSKGTACFLLFFPFFVFWVTFCSNYWQCLRERDAEPLNCYYCIYKCCFISWM